ncbi:MAG: LamG-like jellyroll fold domain-containing protein, partial [Sulfuricaulis sp.]|nr:LamG-like jellyroll fold domain-containing protein [Sulfuricaulis sp.]
YDGTTLKIYVDGIVQLSDATTFAGKPPKALPVKWVGRAQDTYFQGRIAGVRLWNVARTQEQIQQTMSRPALTPVVGQYIVTNAVSSLGAVARPFNLRLIVHKSATETRLFQRVYHGLGLAANAVLVTRENLLDRASLNNARRISAVHLPFSDGNAGWPFTGEFAQGQSLSAQVNLDNGDYASNPFLHSFHPDHDNLNATFDSPEPRGAESYDIERKMTLTFTAPGSDFASLISGGNQMTGQYSEELTLKGRGNESRRIDTTGFFVLKRVSDIPTLTTTP